METVKPSWDASAWSIGFVRAQKPYNHVSIKQLRQSVFFHTQQVVEAGGYLTADNREVLLSLSEETIRGTCFYAAKMEAQASVEHYDTHIEVVSRDCLAFASNLVSEGCDEVCVLNMASATSPGGGVLNGAGAQEEYLFRCSDYYRSLYQYVDYGIMFGVARAAESYPMHRQHGGIFTPKVTVFRDTEARGYALLDKPFQINLIAVAGINHPPTIMEEGEVCIDPKVMPTIYNKVHTIFRIARKHRQKTLVLGAWGCGAFGNPPRHIARIFKETLQEPEFAGTFAQVYFAIKGGPNGGNYTPFAEVFGQ